jgi:hypothetical protein
MPAKLGWSEAGNSLSHKRHLVKTIEAEAWAGGSVFWDTPERPLALEIDLRFVVRYQKQNEFVVRYQQLTGGLKCSNPQFLHL